jgi:hypothetical protein
MRERDIQNSILREFATRDDMRLWVNPVGNAIMPDGSQRRIRFGLIGQADLTGILSDGRRIEIEVKNEAGIQSERQVHYQKMIEKFKGLYILARSVDDVYQMLYDAGYTDIQPVGGRA